MASTALNPAGAPCWLGSYTKACSIIYSVAVSSYVIKTAAPITLLADCLALCTCAHSARSGIAFRRAKWGGQHSTSRWSPRSGQEKWPTSRSSLSPHQCSGFSSLILPCLEWFLSGFWAIALAEHGFQRMAQHSLPHTRGLLTRFLRWMRNVIEYSKKC